MVYRNTNLILLSRLHSQLFDFKVQNILPKVQNLHFGVKCFFINSSLGILLLIF